VGPPRGHARIELRRLSRCLLSLLALSAILLGPAAPLLAAFGADEGVGCCRGRCCCSSARPVQGTCVRAACPCRPPSQVALPGIPVHEAVLSTVARLDRIPVVSDLPRIGLSSARPGFARTPDPPPWRALHARPIA
jgi:hypothetical protein